MNNQVPNTDPSLVCENCHEIREGHHNWQGQCNKPYPGYGVSFWLPVTVPEVTHENTDPSLSAIKGAINNESFDHFIERIFDMCTRGKDHWLREDLLSFLENNKSLPATVPEVDGGTQADTPLAQNRNGLCWFGDGSCNKPQTDRTFYCADHEFKPKSKQLNQPPWVIAALQEDVLTERPRLDFWRWWRRDGNFYDPDTDDVPWFDKRKFLAERAFDAGVAQSTNYIANRAVYPRQVSFANGRVVSIRWEDGEAYLEVSLNEQLIVDAQPVAPQGTVEGETPELYFFETGTDGFWSAVVPFSELKQTVHNSMCMCGRTWDKCESPGVTETALLIDDRTEWEFRDGNYRWSWSQDFEDGYIRATRLMKSQSVAPPLVAVQEKPKELRDFEVKSFPCTQLDHGHCDHREKCWCACHASVDFKNWWMTQRAGEVPDVVYQKTPDQMRQKAKDLTWEAWRACYQLVIAVAVSGEGSGVPALEPWINICHSLSPTKERCRKEDEHEGPWHIGMRNRWHDKDQHPDSPTSEEIILCPHGKRAYRGCTECGPDAPMSDEESKAALSSPLQEGAGWIECKQELPPIGSSGCTSGVVLGFREGSIDLYRRHTGKPWGWVYCSDWKWGEPQPTHWMPLPAAPDTKGGS